MIKEYHRPKSVPEAEQLFEMYGERCVPLGGGSMLSRSKQDDLCVVDLQDLGLNRIEVTGQKVHIGATVTLQQLLEFDSIPALLKEITRRSATLNLRNQATIGGYIVTAGGRSPLAIALMALDAQLIWHPAQKIQNSGDWFSLRQALGYWISGIQFNSNVQLGYEQVARTPMDVPILAIAVARWPSGRTRVVLGGYGNAPILALDGPEGSGVLEAVKNALAESSDEWASAEYRQDVGQVLAKRILSTTA
jgi:CO/xanthine dehydrogenase FAD-binding subunit